MNSDEYYDLYPQTKERLMAAMYQFPKDFETPNCEMCGELPPHRVILPNAKDTGMNLVECEGCGLRFFSPRPVWSVVGPLVAEEKEQAWNLFNWWSFTPVPDVAVQQVNIRSYYNRMLTDVEGWFGRVPGNMLEVGGNVGWFSVCARDFGVKEIYGCDINPFATAIAQERNGLAGHVTSDFADYDRGRAMDGGLDFVVALDYLEHTYTPWADIQKMVRMLAPGGVLLAKTFLDEEDIRREMLAPPCHSIHWTKHTLTGAIQRAGLSIKQFRMDYPADHPYMVIVIAQKGVTQ